MFPLPVPQSSNLVFGPVAHSLHVRIASPYGLLYKLPAHQGRIVEVGGFFLLQIGLPVLDGKAWTLVSDATFQSLSVRASGFNILPIANFAPALL
jgi:hypothetical protein